MRSSVEGRRVPARCRRRFRNSSALGARSRPVVWIVDDVHFAGREGLEALLQLGRAARGHAALVVATSRPDCDASHAVRALPGADRIELPRLSDDDVTDLLAGTYGDRELASALTPTVMKHSDGVPFYVLQIQRALEEQGIVERTAVRYQQRRSATELEVPASLRDVVRLRLDALPAGMRRILDAAAVAGREFDADAVSRATDTPLISVLQDLAELERKHGLVRSSGKTLRFDHAVIQDALYEAMPEPLRRELHARIADAGAIEDAADRIRAIRHHLRGSRPEQALPHLDAALEGLRGRPQPASELARLALDVPGLLQGERRFDIVKWYGDWCAQLGDRNRQERAGQEALAIADELGDESRRAKALSLIASSMIPTTRDAAPIPQFEEALAIAQRNGDEDLVVIVSINFGIALGALGALDDAMASYERAIAASRRLGDVRKEAAVYVNLGNLNTRGDHTEARRCFERALALTEGTEHRREHCYAHAGLGSMLWEMGYLQEALDHIEVQLRIAAEIGDVSVATVGHSNRGLIELARGRPEAALRSLQRTIDLRSMERVDRWLVMGYGNLAEAYCALGRLDEARRALAQGRRLAQQHDLIPSLAGYLELNEAELALLQQDPARAIVLARKTLAAVRTSRYALIEWRAHLAIAHGHLDQDEIDEARAVVAEALEKAPTVPQSAIPLRVLDALLRDDARAADAIMNEDAFSGVGFTMRMVLHLHCWQRGQLESHRAHAKSMLTEFRTHIAPERHADLLRVPLFRAIDAF